jgi:TPR repeat protein
LSKAHKLFLDGDSLRAAILYAKAAEEGYETAQINTAWLFDQDADLLQGAIHSQAVQRLVTPEEIITLQPTVFPDKADVKTPTEEPNIQASDQPVSTQPQADEALPTQPQSKDEQDTIIVPAYPDTLEFEELQGRQLAHRHLRLSAQQGNVESLRSLGDYAFYGWISEPDYLQAANRYQAASELRNAHAMFNLGYMHEHGLGLPRDFYLAKRYYDLALSTSPEAYAPVQLALLKLRVHQWLSTWLYAEESEGSDTEATESDEIVTVAQENSASSVPENRGKVDRPNAKPVPQQDEFATGRDAFLAQLPRSWQDMWKLYLDYETNLLLALVACLAVMVFRRAN